MVRARTTGTERGVAQGTGCLLSQVVGSSSCRRCGSKPALPRCVEGLEAEGGRGVTPWRENSRGIDNARDGLFGHEIDRSSPRWGQGKMEGENGRDNRRRKRCRGCRGIRMRDRRWREMLRNWADSRRRWVGVRGGIPAEKRDRGQRIGERIDASESGATVHTSRRRQAQKGPE